MHYVNSLMRLKDTSCSFLYIIINEPPPPPPNLFIYLCSTAVYYLFVCRFNNEAYLSCGVVLHCFPLGRQMVADENKI